MYSEDVPNHPLHEGSSPEKGKGFAPLDASKLTISLTNQPQPIPLTSATTTRTHTDHMLTVEWRAAHGWSTPRIMPYANLSLPPTASVFHYATSCFEGMKLYRGDDGKLRLFRPLENCRRLLDSATRISLPSFEPTELKKLIEELCRIEGPRWLPKDISRGTCLYLRPMMIGVDADLGFQIPQEVLLCVFITHWPSASVSPNQVQPSSNGLKLLASTEQFTRAWPGGSGNSKVAANYGPSLMAHGEAKRRGFDQVLWLFGPHGDVTEAGSANFFVIWRSEAGSTEIATPPLNGGLILPGITRRSVLELARQRFAEEKTWDLDNRPVLAMQMDVVERTVTIFEVIKAAQDGRLLGAFAVGTACFVNVVSQIDAFDQSISLDVNTVPHAALLRQWLSDIMYGLEEHDWAEIVQE